METGLRPLAFFVVLASLASLSLVGLLVGAASAQNDASCDQVVVDGAAVLGDGAAVAEAANAADQLGTVRVLILGETPSGLLDALGERAAVCAWVGADGVYLPDHLVIAVSVGDRATQIVYGAEWQGSLDGTEDVIVDRVINPQFAAGNFSGGLVSGLEQIASIRSAADPEEPEPDSDAAPSTSSKSATPPTSLAGVAEPTSESDVAVAPNVDGTTGARLISDSSQGPGWLVPLVMVGLLIATAVPVVIVRRGQRTERPETQ